MHGSHNKTKNSETISDKAHGGQQLCKTQMNDTRGEVGLY